MRKYYISFVIQSSDYHRHDFEIVEFEESKIALYSDPSSQQVIEWLDRRQKELKPSDKLVVLNFFAISNLSLK